MDDTNKDEDTMLDNAEQQIQNEIKLLQEQLAFSREIKRKKELFKETQNKKIEALKSEIRAKTLQYNLEIAYITSQIEELEQQIKNTDISKIMDEIDDSTIANVVANAVLMENEIAIANAVAMANEIAIANEIPSKKPRSIIKRKPLHEVIKQPTQFKAIIKGTEFRCYTEDGHKIISLSSNVNKTYSSLNDWLEQAILTMFVNNTTKKSVYEVVSYYNNTKKEWRPLKTDYTSDTLVLN
jgi:multidrug efflux pump subunit AcrA (membrane-fusion protein)